MKFAVIGLGACGGYWLEAIKRSGNITVKCCDSDKRKLYADAEIDYFSSVRDMLDSDPADYNVIATDVTSHYVIAKQIIESGQNVITEKPVDVDYGRIEELYSSAKERGVIFRCSYHSAFSPDIEYFLAHRESITADLGKLVGISAKFFDPYMSGRNGVLYGSYVDSGINALSVVARLTGLANVSRLTDVSGFLTPDNMHSVTRYVKDGVNIEIQTDWLRGINSKTTELICENGAVMLDHSGQRIVKSYRDSKTAIDCNVTGLPRLINQYVNVINNLDKSEFVSYREIYKLFLNK